MALEAVIAAPSGDIRVVTTHLEYYSAKQRLTQVAALRRIHAEGHAHAREAQVTRHDGGPFQALLRPRATLIAGDFNFEPGSDGYAQMLAAFDDDTTSLFDAWRELHPEAPHPATFKRYGKKFPGEPEQHCDFVFASEELQGRVREVQVDATTQASDHQPIIVTLA
jgi:endonuclease/exonuclease/phosphatase family metal-dependent hydrolase